MNADDLDDGLVYDAAFSDNESGQPITSAPTSDNEEVAEKPAEVNPKKRVKGQSAFQEKKRIKMQMDIDKKKSLSQESSVEVIADFLNDSLRKKNPDLSALELAELYFKKTDFRSTADFLEPRTLDNLPKYILGRFDNMLKSTAPGKKSKKKSKKNAEPPADQERKFIVVLSMSAIRACDIHRALRDIPGSSLKLINKNKIDVDLKLVKSTWARVLCCTPGRLQKVLHTEDSPLKAEEIKIVMVDNSYLDQKMQNVFNIAETNSTLRELTSLGAKIYLY